MVPVGFVTQMVSIQTSFVVPRGNAEHDRPLVHRASVMKRRGAKKPSAVHTEPFPHDLNINNVATSRGRG